MRVRPPRDTTIKSLAIFCAAVCGVGSASAMFIIMVRVPALARTKLDLLFGTLLGTAVALLFAIAALLIILTYLVHRASLPPSLPPVGDGHVRAR